MSALFDVHGERLPRPTPEQFQAEWNEAVPFRRCVSMSEDRRTALRNRLKEKFWRDNWQEGLRLIQSKPFLCGKNPRKWKATVEWFLRPGSLARLFEGYYDGEYEEPNTIRMPWL